MVDVIIILIFYDPNGSMRRLRVFEIFVMGLVLAVVGCFIAQLSYIRNTTVGEILRGFAPSSDIIEPEGYVPRHSGKRLDSNKLNQALP